MFSLVIEPIILLGAEWQTVFLKLYMLPLLAWCFVNAVFARVFVTQLSP